MQRKMEHPFTTPSNESRRAFINSFKKPRLNLTVLDVIKKSKQANHETWRICICGCYQDLKKNNYCEECGAKL